MSRVLSAPVVALVLTLSLLAPRGGLSAQDELVITSGDRAVASVPIVRHRGFAAVAATGLEAAGWSVRGDRVGWLLDDGDGVVVDLRAGAPFVVWGSERRVIQLAHAPFVDGDALFVPLQLVTDVLPDRLPRRFAASGHAELVVVTEAGRSAPAAATRPRTPPGPPERFVVVIDPGHGGEDPGAMGPGGAREKDVALRFARALAEELRGRPGLEVHLTRDRDVLVPLWKRGEEATRLKGDHPGVFLSIHVNALPNRSVRGVETYFLSEARTEHEQRVAALENASLALEPGDGGGRSDLGFILSELRNHDYMHWSAELAEQVQRDLAAVHPGPNRGVKQGPFAVITNALMPAVLIETGFISNPTEERLLGDESFHGDAARAIAKAVTTFFESYPPGRAAIQREGG